MMDMVYRIALALIVVCTYSSNMVHVAAVEATCTKISTPDGTISGVGGYPFFIKGTNDGSGTPPELVIASYDHSAYSAGHNAWSLWNEKFEKDGTSMQSLAQSIGTGASRPWDMWGGPKSRQYMYQSRQHAGGELLRSKDSGASWQVVRGTPAGQYPQHSQIAGDDTGMKIIVGSSAGVVISDDGGDTFTVYDGSRRYHGVCSNADFSILYAFTEGNVGFIKSTDGGANWSQMAQISATAGQQRAQMNREDGSSVFILSYGGAASMGVWRSIDGGSSWSHVYANTAATLITIECDLTCTRVVTGHWSGHFVLSRNNGDTWSDLSLVPGANNFPIEFVRIWADNPNYWFATSSTSQNLLISTDDGTTWSRKKGSTVKSGQLDVSGCQSSGSFPANECVLKCVNTGTVAPICSGQGNEYTYQDTCQAGTCSAPAITTGYITQTCAGETGLSDCKVSCNEKAGYYGTAIAGCAAGGGAAFTLSGCAPCNEGDVYCADSKTCVSSCSSCGATTVKDLEGGTCIEPVKCGQYVCPFVKKMQPKDNMAVLDCAAATCVDDDCCDRTARSQLQLKGQGAAIVWERDASTFAYIAQTDANSGLTINRNVKVEGDVEANNIQALRDELDTVKAQMQCVRLCNPTGTPPCSSNQCS